MALEVIILAAGQGTRMKSQLPKVLHPLAGKPMVGHVIDIASELSPAKVHVVVGHGAPLLKDYLADRPLNIAEQTEQLGTGHAVDQAMPHVDSESTVLVLYGDVPLIKKDTLEQLVARAEHSKLALLTVELADPTGYGRIVRNVTGDVEAIVEHKDASAEQLSIQEINTGILALPAAWLKDWLPALSSDNAQGEYYLTDIIEMAAKADLPIAAIQPSSEQEVQGVNNRLQLAELERWYQRQQADHWMTQGATLLDPLRVDFRGDIKIGQDVTVDINVIFEGRVRVGNNVSIGANCILKDCEIADGSVINANSMIDDSKVAENCLIGPFARLRPGTRLDKGAKVGNFVETKKTHLGEGSKINHLSYVGDAEVGCGANIGAGTITCNYDGVNKFKTEIGNGAFIGSNTSLVAPVKVGDGATTGAGSTITKEIPDNALGVARGRQTNLTSWKKPVKQ
ncbi:MAG: bifunctional UDP-N-acetylglucosamine diphosphorylase/glucosamine-1-phosphate N-acetyltransferase GlmU [Motiliproteus sp.]|nr:bifunctional UDP-N-acetylglucosamine diphosphorylase/glucosamine-1-phosphate N-acetyltransferase GlmU [Motiliproteus sp.]MCW9053795.1 bifunctional UDP-N-acetylglucosamine diphosphorylase/glucosamine-1-phosphate N-acetyltransferase GlmU [Motiliproteus sp.]